MASLSLPLSLSLSLSFGLSPSFCLKSGSFPALVLDVQPNQPDAAQSLAASGQIGSKDFIFSSRGTWRPNCHSAATVSKHETDDAIGLPLLLPASITLASLCCAKSCSCSNTPGKSSLKTRQEERPPSGKILIGS
ncbi:hypothetical protein EYF80_041987 [Liparis tanakae]|uniref:Secreted protein n=1 Tax=Liparis tanakae TaxID=230148 RepID=A0A4Z2G3P3_9TELE|nr:hypothetical protein EYF80_041987 [Liparis tanakae]